MTVLQYHQVFRCWLTSIVNQCFCLFAIVGESFCQGLKCAGVLIELDVSGFGKADD